MTASCPHPAASLSGLVARMRAAAHGMVQVELWVAACYAAAVLLAFGTVVANSARDAQSVRQEQALRHEAIWRCKALRVRALREACLCRSRRDMPADSAGIQALVEASAHPTAGAAACTEATSAPATGSPSAGEVMRPPSWPDP